MNRSLDNIFENITIPSLPEWRRVSDNTVVTFNKEKKPASTFTLDSWNIRAYSTNTRHTHLHFSNVAAPPPGTQKDEANRIGADTKIQAKQIMYFLMHRAYDSMPAPGTLVGQMNAVRSFCRYATLQSMTLYEGLSDVATVLSYIASEPPPKSQRLHAILVHLHRLGPKETGIKIPLHRLHEPMIARFRERDDMKQHAVIPTRIYHHFLTVCESYITFLENSLAELLALMEVAYDRTPPPLSKEAELIFDVFDQEQTQAGLSRLVSTIGLFCQIVVIAFTGMRAHEAESLPYNCLKTVVQDGIKHYLVQGVTTKLTRGRVKRTSWVTSHLGVRAINVAQAIFGFVHHRHSTADWRNSTDGSHLLVCRHGIASISDYGAGNSPSTFYDLLPRMRELLFCRITEEDLRELHAVDPFRAWEDEIEYSVNALWPFTRHQLRRTLALYAHRSGLVSLPSLKRQLQHITVEMAMYYARGSAFAKDFLKGDKKHFAYDWAEAAHLSEYLGYASAVLFSEDALFGGHVAWAKSESVRSSPVSVYSRERTIEMFKKGQLSYKETVLGGCTSTEPCKINPLHWLPSECLETDCKNQVIVLPKLERAIAVQEKRVERLRCITEGSVEFRVESNILKTLIVAREKYVAKEGA